MVVLAATTLVLAGCAAPEVSRIAPVPVGTIPVPTKVTATFLSSDSGERKPALIEATVEATPVQESVSTISTSPTAVDSVPADGLEGSVPEVPRLHDVRPEPVVTAASEPSAVDWLSDVLEDAGWPEALWAEAKAVMWCESRWNPQAISSTADYGIWQINARTWSAFFGEPPETWLDPVIASRRALVIYQRAGGWSPWVCSRY